MRSRVGFMKKVNALAFYYGIVSLLLMGCNPNGGQYERRFGQENALWTESIYLRGYQPTTREKLADEHLREYAETLKNNGIKYAYLFAGPYGEDGHLPDYAFATTAIRSVKRLKEYYPEIVILPWVGGVQNKTVHLQDAVWVAQAIADTKKLVETLDVPGVHVDFEYILPGDPYLDQTIGKEQPGQREAYGNTVNNFHKKLREAMPHAFVSSVVLATSPDTKPWKRKTSMVELSILTQYVDQLAFLYYDTAIHSQALFEKNCNLLLQDIQTLKNNNDIQYLIAIGTFINEPELHKYRNVKIESIPNSLETIKQEVLRLDSTAQIVDGIALYGDWTTEKVEWEEFRKHWME